MGDSPEILKNERKFWRSPLFLGMGFVKIAASFLAGSSYLAELFTPFVNWYVTHGLKNPWEFFFDLQRLNMFPYPAAMLWIMSLPRLLFSPVLSPEWTVVTPLHLFVMRIPLLACDVLIFMQLLRYFPNQMRRIILIFWCSPILFFINYIHGQLDIIPTAIFFVAVYELLERRHVRAVILFAVAAACKTHIIIAFPFLAIYLYKRKMPIPKIALHFLGLAAVYACFLLPYAGSEAFRAMVFNSPEQKRLFDFSLQVSSDLSLVVCPTVVFLLFLKFASYKKLNREILLMFLGILFAALVVFVPPMPGWFMWSLPFLIYFYLSNKEFSRAPFILYNLIYCGYFLFFFEQENAFITRINEFFPVRDLALSAVMASVGFIAWWMFNLGIQKNEELKIQEAPLLVGIGGDSGTGKHTLVRVLRYLVGRSRSIPILGDDFHKWERGNDNWQVYTHLDPAANRLHQHMDVAVALKDGNAIEIGHYDHHSGKFTDPETVSPSKFIFFVGLHPFYLKKMRDIMPVKIFMDIDETLRRHWKTRRDTAKRQKREEDVLLQMTSRQADREKYIEPQKDFADLIIRYEPLAPLDPDNRRRRIPLRSIYTMDNSVNLEPLLRLLRQVKTLTVDHTSDVKKQRLEVTGTVRARDVMNIAFQLGINLDELFIHPRGWLGDSHGISQLVFLMLYHDCMRS